MRFAALAYIAAQVVFGQSEFQDDPNEALEALQYPRLVTTPIAQRTIHSIAYRDDGRLLVTDDGWSRNLWDSERGILLSSAANPSRSPSPFSSRVASDGRTVWTASPQGWAQVDLHTRKRIRGRAAEIRDMFLSDANSEMAALRQVHTGHVMVIEPGASPEEQKWIAEKGGPEAVALHPSGQFIAIGNYDGRFVLWNRKERKKVREISEAAGAFTRVAYSPDGRWIAILAQPRSCMNIDPNSVRWRWICQESSGQQSHSKLIVLDGATGADYSAGVLEVFFGLAFSRDGNRLAMWGKSSMAIADPVSKQILGRFPIPPGEGAQFAFSPDGTFITGGSLAIRAIETGTGRVALTWNDPPERLMPDSVLTPQGRWLYAMPTGGDLRFIEIHPTRSSKKLTSEATLAGAVQISADGGSVAAFAQDGLVRIWNTATGAIRCRIAGANEDRVPRHFRLGPDGNRIALSGAVVNGRRAIDIWDTAQCKRLETFEPGDARLPAVEFWKVDGPDPEAAGRVLTHLEFSPDGRRLAWTTGDNLLRVWDVAARRELTVSRIPVPAVFSERDPAAKRVNNFVQPVRGERIPLESLDSERLDAAKLLAYRQLMHGTAGIAFGPQQDVVAVVDRNAQVRLWRLGTSILTLGAIPSQATFILDNRHHNPFPLGSVLFLPDGRQALTSIMGRHPAELFDLGSGSKVLQTTGNRYGYARMYQSPDHKVFVSGAGANFLSVFDAATGQVLGRISALGDGSDWLAVAEKRYVFDGSAAARRQMAWRFSTDEFDVASGEAFFSDFYRPGLVAELFNAAVPPPVRDLASIDRRQARIEIGIPDRPPTTVRTDSRREIPLRIRVSPPGPEANNKEAGKIRDLRLFRNGSLVKIWHGDLVSGGMNFQVDATVSIAEGRNDFTAYCFNSDNVASREGRLAVTGAPNLKRKGRNYVIAIGINRYANPEFNLRYAATDSQAVSARLQSLLSNEGSEPDVTVVNLVDADASKANILAAFRALAGRPATIPALRDLSRAEPEDRVIVFFAGHGWARDNRFYLIPHDLGYDKPRSDLRSDAAGQARVLSHSISDDELASAVEGITASEMLLIIDACNSGQVLESEESRQGPFNVKGLAQLAYDKGMYVLTASQSYQVALETSKLEHGYLTYALIKDAFDRGEADIAPADGRLSVREWFDYSALRVPQLHRDQSSAARLLAMDSAGGARVEAYQTPRVFYRRDAAESFSIPLTKPAVASVPARSKIEGQWTGLLGTGPRTVRLNLSLFVTGDTLSGAIGPADRVVRPDQVQSPRFVNGKLTFKVERLNASFEGSPDTDGETIKGSWIRNARVTPLTFTRVQQ